MKITIIGSDFTLQEFNPLTKRVYDIYDGLTELNNSVEIISLNVRPNNTNEMKDRNTKFLFNKSDTIWTKLGKIRTELNIIKANQSSTQQHILWLETTGNLLFTYIVFKIRSYRLIAIIDEVEDLYGQVWQQFKTRKSLLNTAYIYLLMLKSYKLLLTRYYAWDAFSMILAITPALKDRISSQTKTKTEYLPNIFSSQRIKYYSEMKSDFESKQGNYFVHCGSNDIIKDGLDILIKGFARFLNFHPDFELVIVGPKHKPTHGKIVDLITYFDIKDRIIFKGIVDDAEMFEILSCSSAQIISKRNNLLNKYNFPTKLVDYIYANRPIVMPDFGIYKQYFTDGLNAFFFQNSDPESLCNALVKVINQKHPEIITKNAFDLFKMRFDSKKYLEVILSKMLVHF